jgi:hypothetical protein
MARMVSTTICTNCLEEFVTKEMYTVSRKMRRHDENNHDEYYAPYCEDCISDKDSYLIVISEPKSKELKQKK